jgi:hypothetical protein
MRRALTLLLLSATILPATTILYNFEDRVATGSSGALTSLTESSSVLDLTVTRQSGTAFDIGNLSGSIPASYSWGHSTLSPFANTSAAAFIFTFSAPISSFSVQVGDFGVDYDTEILRAYTGARATGSVVATGTGVWGGQDLSAGDSPATDSVSGTAFLSVLVLGGSKGFPNSLYYDNIMVTPDPVITPEPASMVMSLAGVAAIAVLGRGKKGAQ